MEHFKKLAFWIKINQLKNDGTPREADQFVINHFHH